MKTTTITQLLQTHDSMLKIADALDVSRATVKKFVGDIYGQYHRVLVLGDNEYRLLTVTKRCRL